MPQTAQLDGLDIDFSQSPPKEWLPSNISLIHHDIFSEPPPELVEKYDIIHVQLFITILRDGNPVPMLHNLMKMLSMYTVDSGDGCGMNLGTDEAQQSQEGSYSGANGILRRGRSCEPRQLPRRRMKSLIRFESTHLLLVGRSLALALSL